MVFVRWVTQVDIAESTMTVSVQSRSPVGDSPHLLNCSQFCYFKRLWGQNNALTRFDYLGAASIFWQRTCNVHARRPDRLSVVQYVALTYQREGPIGSQDPLHALGRDISKKKGTWHSPQGPSWEDRNSGRIKRKPIEWRRHDFGLMVRNWASLSTASSVCQ